MIQLARGNNSSTAYGNYFYVNIYDAYENKDNIDKRPIITLRSQETGNFVNLLPGSGASNYVTTYKERYVKMQITLRTSEALSSGFVNLGTIDRPYGFYDITIRENSTGFNAIPSQETIDSLNIVYQGLAYVYDNKWGQTNPAVEYKEYTDNDSDTANVYITNTYS
jgi:hypothetical protein|tara:strand:- start:449 stop:946 length:498 start_codon:yes stop_codon:yes gene_type:complete